jgi:cellulase/cellobiase CelA1
MKHTENTLLRKRKLIRPVPYLAAALSLAVATSVMATNIKTTTTTIGDHWTSDAATSAYGKWSVGKPTGRYLTHIDHWNPSSNASISMSSETDPNVAPTFSLDTWTDVTLGSGALDFTKSASVYDVAKSTWSTLEGEDGSAFVDENGHNQPGHTHAPAAYPSIYKGCHWGSCSVGTGAPFPILVSNIATLQSTWSISATGQSATSGVWDAAYDIWFDTNTRGHLPGDPAALAQKPSPVTPQELQYGQPDGAEVMIWMNNRGYNNTPITPAGSLTTTTTINVGGTNMTFDVWVARLGAADAYQWNVISYVAQNKVTSFGNFDANLFVNHAKTLTCATGQACVQDAWWITSIQAGFEVWANGAGLKTTAFDVVPTFKPGANTAVNSGRTNDSGTPLVHWQVPFMINTTGCAGGTATYSIVEAGDSTNNMPIQPPLTGTMTESQPGYYSAFVPQLYPRHGNASVTMTITCPDNTTQPTTIPIYIDPSGIVKNTKGEPIDSATVTLYRMTNGVYTAVPNGSTIMAPYNRRNPDTSGEMGTFGWDVQAGTYKVRAAKAGCYKPGTPGQAYVETGALVVPPAVTNLELVLECPSTGGSNNGVTVQLTVNGQDWQNGYCRNIVLTNTTSQPKTWNVTFPLPFPGNITQTWNINYTKSGNNVTAWGVGWNNVLQPGQVLNQQGFCATK